MDKNKILKRVRAMLKTKLAELPESFKVIQTFDVFALSESHIEEETDSVVVPSQGGQPLGVKGAVFKLEKKRSQYVGLYAHEGHLELSLNTIVWLASNKYIEV